MLAATLPTAFALQAVGVRYPATWSVLAGAVVMVVGGPLLTHFLQRIMFAKRLGSPTRYGSSK